MENQIQLLRKENILPAVGLILGAIVVGMWISTVRVPVGQPLGVRGDESTAVGEEAVLPAEGVTLPVQWGSLGTQMREVGVIDEEKFRSLYSTRGGMDEEIEALLTGDNNGPLVISEDNAHGILNLLWALGLANKNEILEKGPMVDARYGGDAGKFASTGGWTLGKGNPMDHYSRHRILTLTQSQQSLVERVSKNIYRPCCGNATHFPDCNHGMAMLGLLELMASQGVDEEAMYRAALAVNSFWFPDTYLTIARYLQSKGLAWNAVSAKEVLGANFSSGAGYRQILEQVEPVPGGKRSSCGV